MQTQFIVPGCQACHVYPAEIGYPLCKGCFVQTKRKCDRCGKLANSGKSMCSDCYRDWNAKRGLKICINCTRKATPNHSMCDNCYMKYKNKKKGRPNQSHCITPGCQNKPNGGNSKCYECYLAEGEKVSEGSFAHKIGLQCRRGPLNRNN